MRMTVQKYRQMTQDTSLTDEEIEQIIENMYQLANIIIDSFLQYKRTNKVTNDTSTNKNNRE